MAVFDIQRGRVLAGRRGRPARVLVAGVPRAGTSWIGTILSRAQGARYVNEPDTVGVGEGADTGTRTLGRRPVLAPGETPPPDYERLWVDAFCASGRETVVVKSVKAHGTLDWIAERFAPKVVVVRAHPLNIVSSWLSMGWTTGPMGEPWFARCRPDLLEAAGGWPGRPAAQIAMRVGALLGMQEMACARHPEWTVVTHESMCDAPTRAFADLYRDVGLRYDVRVRDFVAGTNAPGTGHDINRRVGEAPRRWRRLDPADRAAAEQIFELLGVRGDPAALA